MKALLNASVGLAEMGFLLIVAGFILIFIAVLILMVWLVREGRKEGKVKGGGIILIGPIPIMCATDKKSALILSILMVVIVVVMLIIMLMGA